MHQEQTEEAEGGGKVLEGCDGETSPAGTVEEETSVKVCEDNEEEEKKAGAEAEGGSEVPHPPSGPEGTVSAEERGADSRGPESLTKATRSPDPLHQIQRHQPTPGGPQISRWDKTIVEKIRSYYEAAAKAEEGGGVEEEEELREGTWWRRRSSFSEIPSGLVKESVSQFDVGEPQWEERTKARSSPPAQPSPESSDPPISFLGLLQDAGPSAGVSQDQKNPNPGGSVQQEAEIQRALEKVCSQPPEDEEEEKETSGRGEEASSNQNQCREETGPGNAAVGNVHEANKVPAAEPFGEPGKSSGSRTDSSWTRTGQRDLAAAHRGSARIRAGSSSQHPRAGSANRVLFEASDVAGIGLFEAGPVVDPVLMENSARILSRVQTLALMYSAKAGSMKLPLHQKQADVAPRPSEPSHRPAPKHQNRVQSQNRPEGQLHSEGKMEIKEPDSKYGNDTKVQHQHQPQTQTGTRTGTRGQDRAEGRSTCQISICGLLKGSSATRFFPGPDSRTWFPCEALMSGQGSVPVPVGQQQQTGVFTLSRPRDFISALNRGSSREVRPPAGTPQDRSERQNAAASRFTGRHTDPEETGGGAR